MEEKSFVEKFLKSYAESTSAKARLKTATFVSPAKLAERRFYWEALTEEGDVVTINVPLPKNIIGDLFSFLFLAAYNCLFIDDLIDKTPPETQGEDALWDIFKSKATKEFNLKQQGRIYVEYLFYILWNQDNTETRDVVIRLSQKDEWPDVFTLIPRGKVHSYVVNALAELGLEHADALENLIPLALDLYLYVNSLRKPTIRKLDDEGIGERAESLARWL